MTMAMTQQEAIEKAVAMAKELQQHCMEHDLMEGIFHGVCVNAGVFQEALLKKFVMDLTDELKKQDVGMDIATIVDMALDQKLNRRH